MVVAQLDTVISLFMKSHLCCLFLLFCLCSKNGFALSPRQYASVDRVFDISGYLVLGEFIDEYDIEEVHHRIEHQRGVEQIKRSYVGKIKVEAILPGYKNLEHEKIGSEYIEVLFAKADLEQLKRTEIFSLRGGYREYVWPIDPENPHYEEYRDILKSGEYYIRPYHPFIGTWVTETESGVSGFLTLEQLGWGSWGAKGYKIRWRAYKDTIRVYVSDDEHVDFQIVESDSEPAKLMLNEVEYRLALSGERFQGLVERMIEQQQMIVPGEGHVAVGVWRLKYRTGISEVSGFQFVAFNPDSSLYWFNSDKELRRFGSWKAIAGEEEFFVKWEKDRGHLAKVVQGSDGDEHLILNVFRGTRMTEEELEKLSVPDEVQVP